MARKIRNSLLENRSTRLKLTIRRRPYIGPPLARGIMLLYRRNKTNGTWVVKASDGHGAYWTKAFADADDYENADGKTVVTFFQAQDRAKQIARGGDDTSETAPITVAGALDDYAVDLKARTANVYNAQWPKAHLNSVLLGKPVQLLSAQELKKWRNGLLGKMKSATINRLCKAFRAALELAAQHDERIQSHDAWKIGLAGLPDAQTARNVILPDEQVHAFVAAAYARNPALGLLVDTLAVTGTRPSQAVRLRVGDLRDHPSEPTLMMPKSAKGGGRNRSEKRLERYSVPISATLAKKLKRATVGRAPDAPLLVRGDGSPWGEGDPIRSHWRHIRDIVTSIGEDPDRVTVYALRHSNIVRMLDRNVPVRRIAALHDTSISQIERNYSAHITEHPDEASRKALLQEPTPAGATVVPIGRR